MVSTIDLWLPILLSAVFVFIASSIFHMALPFHKSDYKKTTNEEKLREAIRAQGLQKGVYMFPRADSMKECGSPEMIEKFKQGPVGILTILPSGAPGMGKCLSLWFLYTVLIGMFVAYVATLALSPGAAYTTVFRLTGTVAILAYALATVPESIWKGQPWSTTFKFVFDGVVYGLVTAGTFGWLWPSAT